MFRINQHLKRFVNLSLSQKRDICQAMYYLSSMVVQIKIRSLSWFWENSITNATSEFDNKLSDKTKAELINTAQNLHESIRLASRLLPFPCECVPRSLVLRDMLQKKGVAAKFQIGVNKENLSLQSHAWVEVYGEAIGEKDDLKTTFKPIGSSNKGNRRNKQGK